MQDLRAQIAQAIRLVRTERRWKPNSVARHLTKRKHQKHLSPEATLKDYDKIIVSVLYDKAGHVYLFWYENTPYISVVALVHSQTWLVMFGLNGLMETAFVIDIPDYLEQPGFEKIGRLDEVMTHES